MPSSPSINDDFKFEDFEPANATDAEPDSANHAGFTDGEAGQNPTSPGSSVDFSVVEFMSPVLAGTLEMIPISDNARDAATTLLDEFTGAARRQRHKKRARAQAQAQEKRDQEKRDRELRLIEKAEREAATRRRWEREQEHRETLRRATAILEAQESAHWVERTLVESAREQAGSLKTAISMAERLGTPWEDLDASLRVHLAEQMVATSKLVTDYINAALDIGSTSQVVVERRRTKRAKQTKG